MKTFYAIQSGTHPCGHPRFEVRNPAGELTLVCGTETGAQEWVAKLNARLP